VLSLTDAETITSFDLPTRRLLPLFQVPSRPSRSLAFSRDGKTWGIFRADCRTDLCNVVTGRKVATLEGHEGFGPHLTFSHDGQILATAGNYRTVRLWRAPRK